MKKRIKEHKEWEIDYYPLYLRDVDVDFLPFHTEINKTRHALEPEYLDLDDEEMKIYENNPLFFEGDDEYEFICKYYRRDNHDIVLELKRYLYKHELLESKDVDYKKMLVDVGNVINSLMHEPYDYISQLLNGNENITIVVSAVFGTTADFVVYFDDPKSSVNIQDDAGSYKYKVFKDGKYSRAEIVIPDRNVSSDSDEK